MARKRKYKKRKKGGTFTLSPDALLTLTAAAAFLSGLLILASYAQSGSILTSVHQFVEYYLGFLASLVAVNLVMLAIMLKFETNFTKPSNVFGFMALNIALMTIFQAGFVGTQIFTQVSSLLGAIPTILICVVAVFIGFVAMFSIEASRVFSGIGSLFSGTGHVISQGASKITRSKSDIAVSEMKPITIKGMKDQPALATTAAQQAVSSPRLNDANRPESKGSISNDLVLNKPLEMGVWEYPPLSLLSDHHDKKAERGDVKKIAATIENTLQSFGIQSHVVEINLGPSVTQYAIEIASGTKLSKITGLANDLALATEAPNGQVRIEAPIPGRNLVGIEVPNKSLEIVSLKTMLASDKMQKHKSKLAVAMGLDVSGTPIISDISKMPHVLIAGTTGSGKSVMVNAFISSLLFRASPAEVKFILIDPKRVELTSYNDIPHLLTPVVVEADKSVSALKWALGEMDKRYQKFAEAGVRNIDSYNEMAGFQAIPYIVIFIDELADLMAVASVEVEDHIARLAQMARATGIHLVLATQRPSVDVITGLIKANIPARVAFNVSSGVDSKVILDTPGAEKLLGRGDMLYIPPDQAKPTRIQGSFVSEQDVKRLVNFIKARGVPVEYTSEVTEQHVNIKGMGGSGGGGDERDPLFAEAVRIICQYDRASSSLLQRRLSIGFNKAARILEQLEAAGVVGPADGSKPREILIKNADEFLAQQTT